MARPALAATLHDPDGRMVSPAREAMAPLRHLYETAHITATPQTDPALLAVLQEAGAAVTTDSDWRIGAGRRRAVLNAVAAGATAVHYCDFDRLLHWQRVAPDELVGIVGRLASARRFDYLILGRTAAAFATHPRVQRETETVTNHAFSAWFGRRGDVGAGSCGITAHAASLIARYSIEPTNATDAEWPAIVHCLLPGRVRYRATTGLSFETADFYAAEITKAGGREEWLKVVYDRPDVWLTRLELSHNSVRAMLAVADRLSRLRGKAGPPQPIKLPLAKH